MASKAPSRPTWWKNTFFWFSGVLLVLAVWGLASGEHVIRDPGQIKEGGLVWIYLGGAVVMYIHGMISHQQAIQHFDEEMEDREESAPVKKPASSPVADAAKE